jgi:hypothetical protein
MRGMYEKCKECIGYIQKQEVVGREKIITVSVSSRKNEPILKAYNET